MAAIIKSKGVLGGKLRISGTRISLDTIGDYLTHDYGISDIRRDYPHLSTDQIKTALSYIEKKASKERKALECKAS